MPGELTAMSDKELLQQLVLSIREIRDKTDLLVSSEVRLETKVSALGDVLKEIRVKVDKHGEYISEQKGGARMLTLLLGVLGGLVPMLAHKIFGDSK
jgi:hypothetical protein